MLGGHLYVKQLKLYPVPPSPGLPVSRWHCQVFIQVRPKPKSLWPPCAPPSPVISASQSSPDDVTLTFAVTFPQTVHEPLTISSHFSTHIECLPNEHCFGVPFSALGDSLTCLPQLLRDWPFSVTPPAPPCALFPLGLWCCLFPALQLHSCHLDADLHFSPWSPPSLTPVPTHHSGSDVSCQVPAVPSLGIHLWVIASQASLKIVFSSRRQAPCAEGRCSPCLLLPPGARPWEKLPSGISARSVWGLAGSPRQDEWHAQ